MPLPLPPSSRVAQEVAQEKTKMLDRYGKAVVEERVRPQHLAEVARYLRMEYGPGTGSGYLLAEAADGSRPRSRKGPSVLQRMAGALAGALRALTPNGSQTEQRRAEPAR